MSGGTWTTQNKVLPGVYIRFKSAGGAGLTVSDRGTVAICEPLSWGPQAVVQTIEAGADWAPFTGYAGAAPQNRFLQEIFKGSNRTAAPNKVLLYRPAAAGSATAEVTIGDLTATALYPGVRGNDLSVIVVEEENNSFTVQTVLDAEIVGEQNVATMAELHANAWVKFSGDGAFTATTGQALSGGADGTVSAPAYASFLTAIEPYQFDILIYDGTDVNVANSMVAFVKRIAEENGQYTQLVAANLTNPDSRFVINVASGVTLDDGTELSAAQACWWVGGAEAGANNNKAGRSRFKAAIVGYLLDIQGAEGIQNFSPDDVEVLAGAEPDAVLINLAIQAVDAAEKVYMTITVA